MISDKSTSGQVLGCLMLNPKLLIEKDKYPIDLSDFTTPLDKYIFVALNNLINHGAAAITPIDVSNSLEQDTVATTLFNNSSGIEYLQDLCEFAQPQNFEYYYSKLKKLNLLRNLQRQGFDISDFYQEDLTNPKAEQINKKFNELTTTDILTEVKKKVLKIENKFEQSSEIESWEASEEMDRVIASFGQTNNFGLPINGKFMNKILNGAETSALTIRSLASGVGKAIPNYTIIPTPNGFKKVEDIKVGDYLYGGNGKPTKVIGVHPQTEKKEIYKVTFKDGRVAECCKEHLWSVYKKRSKKLITIDTQAILQQGLRDTNGAIKFSIPLNKAIEYNEKSLYPLPYTMGAILGDSSFRYDSNQKSIILSGQDEEIIKNVAEELNCDYKKNSTSNFSWIFKLKNIINNRKNLWVEEVLVNYPDLWNKESQDKYIPNDYLYSSIEQRMELLKGLLDTEGSIDEKGRIGYYTNSKIMATQVQDLCRGLGFIVTITKDCHKNTSIVYIVHIQCDNSLKKDLFKLKRKKDRALLNESRTIYTECRDSNGIINIEPTGNFTEMTCFTVDNEDHLFLMNDYIVTHNTRLSVADACKLAFPFYWEDGVGWVKNGGVAKDVLFIMTEQKPEQILKMVLAYLTNINESKFKGRQLTDEESNRLIVANEMVKKYNTLHLMRIPDPNIEEIKLAVRERVITLNIQYVFFDYIFISPAILNEFKGHNIRNDEALLLMATALKDLAIELNISVFTSTQINAKGDDNTEIRNESALAGGRSTINKADNGVIGSRPTNDEIDILKEIPALSNFPTPNIVFDVFKVRSGQWTQIKVWSQWNPGTLRLTDLFVTDSRMNVINGIEDELTLDWTLSDEDAQYLDEMNKKSKVDKQSDPVVIKRRFDLEV